MAKKIKIYKHFDTESHIEYILFKADGNSQFAIARALFLNPVVGLFITLLVSDINDWGTSSGSMAGRTRSVYEKEICGIEHKRLPNKRQEKIKSKL